MDRIDFLLSRGWQKQDIPGLWRHPWKANGSELTTLQALQVEANPPPEDEIRALAISLI